MLVNKKIIKIIKENYIWVIALLAFIGTIFSNVLKFVEYLTSEAYFSYFGLNHGLYKYSDTNYIYSFCISIIFGLALFYLCCKTLYHFSL